MKFVHIFTFILIILKGFTIFGGKLFWLWRMTKFCPYSSITLVTDQNTSLTITTSLQILFETKNMPLPHSWFFKNFNCLFKTEINLLVIVYKNQQMSPYNLQGYQNQFQNAFQVIQWCKLLEASGICRLILQNLLNSFCSRVTIPQMASKQQIYLASQILGNFGTAELKNYKKPSCSKLLTYILTRIEF